MIFSIDFVIAHAVSGSNRLQVFSELLQPSSISASEWASQMFENENDWHGNRNELQRLITEQTTWVLRATMTNVAAT